jgi:ABC-2 type transport system ATP-binding protein
MISLKNVTKTYSGTTKAVDGISLDIEPGKIFGFLGPNGAGKTTTIKMITGILAPDSGVIEVGGFDVVKNPLEAKRVFGYVPDNPDVFLRLKGIEYLNFLASVYGVDSATKVELVENLAREFEIFDALGSRLQSYSHGMRQKIVLIGSLLHRPKIWILDEPLTGLDPKSSFILKKMMRTHADEGGTIFFSTHVLDVAEKICDIVAVINHGKIDFYGKLDELKQKFSENSSLEKIFLEITDDNENKYHG